MATPSQKQLKMFWNAGVEHMKINTITTPNEALERGEDADVPYGFYEWLYPFLYDDNDNLYDKVSTEE